MAQPQSSCRQSRQWRNLALLDIDCLAFITRLPRVPDLDKCMRLARPGHRPNSTAPQLLQQVGSAGAAKDADESTACRHGGLDLGRLRRTLDFGVAHVLG